MFAHWLEEGLGGGMGLRRLPTGLDDVSSTDLSKLRTLSEGEGEGEVAI